MSPKSGYEVMLTDIETEVMSIFVKRKVLNDRLIAVLLMQLIHKLEGIYAQKEHLE